MSYEVHIARKGAAEDDGPAITRAEWEALVAADPELELAAGGGPSAIWTGHPARAAGQEREGVLLLFSPWSGYVSVDSVERDAPTLRKLIRVARALGGGAVLRGDDGTVFELDGEEVVRRVGARPFSKGARPASPGDPTEPVPRRGLRRRLRAGLSRLKR